MSETEDIKCGHFIDSKTTFKSTGRFQSLVNKSTGLREDVKLLICMDQIPTMSRETIIKLPQICLPFYYLDFACRFSACHNFHIH